MPANEQNGAEADLDWLINWQAEMAKTLKDEHAKLYEFISEVEEKGKPTNVFKVREKKENGRYFALKRVKKSEAVREMEMLADLEHDNIVAFMDSLPYASDDDFVYIRLKWFESKPLNEHMVNLKKSGRRIADEYCLDIAEQILESIKYIHTETPKRKSIVHRDIKPDNFLVSNNGKVKMNDLGLARLAAAHASQSAGAVGYRAPEATKACNSILATDPKAQPPGPVNGIESTVYKESDIFSTGVLLYELFSGDMTSSLLTLSDGLDSLWTRDDKNKAVDLPEDKFETLFKETPSKSAKYKAARLLHAETKDVEKKRALLDKSIRRCLKYKHTDRYQSAETLRVDVRIAFNPEWIHGEKGIDTAFGKHRSPEKLEAICEAYSQIVTGCKTQVEYLADSEVLRERNNIFANYLSDIIKGLSANLLQGAKPDRYWPEKDSQIYHEAVKLIASKYPKTDEIKSMKVPTISCADLSDFGEIFANSQYAAILSVFGKMKVQNGA